MAKSLPFRSPELRHLIGFITKRLHFTPQARQFLKLIGCARSGLRGLSSLFGKGRILGLQLSDLTGQGAVLHVQQVLFAVFRDS